MCLIYKTEQTFIKQTDIFLFFLYSLPFSPCCMSRDIRYIPLVSITQFSATTLLSSPHSTFYYLYFYLSHSFYTSLFSYIQYSLFKNFHLYPLPLTVPCPLSHIPFPSLSTCSFLMPLTPFDYWNYLQQGRWWSDNSPPSPLNTFTSSGHFVKILAISTWSNGALSTTLIPSTPAQVYLNNLSFEKQQLPPLTSAPYTNTITILHFPLYLALNISSLLLS